MKENKKTNKKHSRKRVIPLTSPVTGSQLSNIYFQKSKWALVDYIVANKMSHKA
jgi:hypothetical protein